MAKTKYLWDISYEPIAYEAAIAQMEAYVNKMYQDDVPEKISLLEHEDVYSLGVSAKDSDVLNPQFPVIKTGRGGQVTYHGPKMRIAYIMLNLKKRNSCDLKKYIFNLEELIINILGHFNIKGQRIAGKIGIWVADPKIKKWYKIAAIGVRVRKWISFHGLAININPNLAAFDNIIPCGINDPDYGVTSLHKLGVKITMAEFDKIFKQEFLKIFPNE